KDLISLYKAIRLINSIRPDVVHTHSPKAGIIGMFASWICGVKLKIHTVAGLPLTEAVGFKKFLLVLVERMTYRFSDYVLPNSIQQKKYIEENIYKNKKIQVIGKGGSNGIDLDYFDPTLFDNDFKGAFRR